MWAAAVVIAAQQGGAVAVDADDIGGVVTSTKGPEAGVWVIAETTELPTRFAKIVVTDDRGRYLLPDLPKANYNVWVRGYGLVDSPKVQSRARQGAQSESGRRAERERGRPVLSGRRTGCRCSTCRTRASFPAREAPANFSANDQEPGSLAALMKTGDIFGSCMTCHQLGDKATREIPKELGTFANSRRRGSAASSRASRAPTW